MTLLFLLLNLNGVCRQKRFKFIVLDLRDMASLQGGIILVGPYTQMILILDAGVVAICMTLLGTKHIVNLYDNQIIKLLNKLFTRNVWEAVY